MCSSQSRDPLPHLQCRQSLLINHHITSSRGLGMVLRIKSPVWASGGFRRGGGQDEAGRWLGGAGGRKAGACPVEDEMGWIGLWVMGMDG